MSQAPGADRRGPTPASAQAASDTDGWPGRGPLLATCLGQFMVVLDSTIVNVALPAMRRGLHLGTSELQWVVNAYLLTLGGLILLGGRLGDHFGRRRVYLIGAAGFSFASLLGGIAPSGGVLLAARAAQGVGAALLAPGTLSLLTSIYTAPRARARALALWNATAASGGALGIFLGGALTAAFGWRSVMFVNVPLGVLVLVLGRATLPETLKRRSTARLDVPGALSITVALTLLVYGTVETEMYSWGAPRTVIVLIAAAAMFVVAALIEARAPNPLIPLPVIRQAPVATALTMMLVIGAVIQASFYFMSLYLQQVRGYGPFGAGLLMLPFGLLVIFTPSVAVRLTARYGARHVAALAPGVAIVGLIWMSRWQAHGSIVVQMVLPAMVFALGVSICFFALAVLLTSSIANSHAGLGSGLLNSGRQVGGSIGLAALTVAASAHTRSLVGAHHAFTLKAVASGYGFGLLAGAGLFLFGMVVLGANAVRWQRGGSPPPSIATDAHGIGELV